MFYFSVTVHVIANLGADTWHLGSNESTVSVEGNRFLLTGFQSGGTESTAALIPSLEKTLRSPKACNVACQQEKTQFLTDSEFLWSLLGQLESQVGLNEKD